ncbi:MAG TPA: c-type cytochrome biogenesis protein CcmI [Amaricoccus sp.]|nr:c-type cytochrome biogenesis protein CcmI [Amaricoccus sp.]
MVEWVFWAVGAGAVVATIAIVFAPLLRRRNGALRRASYDLQVHRDQLREVEADVARGILSEAEAAATRIEVSRRLLADAAAEASETAAQGAPARVTRLAAPAMAIALVLAAGGLYLGLGSPELPDQPLALRQAREAEARANRPDQAEAEALAERAGNAPAPAAADAEDVALVARLQEALASRPDDIEGHRLLARSLAGLGRWAEARVAQERVVALLGDGPTAADLTDLAEMQVIAAGGYVSPEAEAALARALRLDPRDPAGRYYSALALMQGGRPDLAYRIWSGLVADGPPDAPWIGAARAGAAEAARQAGLPAAGPEGGAGGPTAADITAMVDGLAARLGTEGGPPEDWARLIRSLGVLGRQDEAQAILAEARQRHAGDAPGLAAIEAAARDAGLAP